MAFSPEAYGAARSLIEQTMAGAGAIKGQDGAPGKSAYEIAKINGFDGTEQEWLDSMVGDEGKSAYEVAKDNGFDGTEEEWLQSLTMEKTLTLAEYEALSEEEKNNGLTYYIDDGDDGGTEEELSGVSKEYVDGEIETVNERIGLFEQDMVSVNERMNLTEQDIIGIDSRVTDTEISISKLQNGMEALITAATHICNNLT